MLRNSGGLSLLRGRLGVHVFVDNHTIDAFGRMGGMRPKGHKMGKGP